MATTVVPPLLLTPVEVSTNATSSGVGSLDNAVAAILMVGKSVALSVEVLAAVGETVGDENADVRGEMLDACREARAAGARLEKLLCCEAAVAVTHEGLEEEELAAALRRLLAGATRILLLADGVVVRQLLRSSSGGGSEQRALATMNHFNEFVKAFCDFGTDTLRLTHVIIGKRPT